MRQCGGLAGIGVSDAGALDSIPLLWNDWKKKKTPPQAVIVLFAWQLQSNPVDIYILILSFLGDNLFYLDVHYVCMLVQRFEPQGRRFTIFHYYYYFPLLLLLILLL